MSEFRYHPYYCEENVWWLCQRSELGDGARDVVFITNPNKQCLFREQRATPAGANTLWDYHVIVVAGGEVWDLDTRIGLHVPVDSYLDATFPDLPPGMQELAPMFRVIDSGEFVKVFCTDRSHMRDAKGGWLQPPPPWDAPCNAAHANQMRFVDLGDDIAGEVLDLPSFRARYSR
jgi:hypothetical protein